MADVAALNLQVNSDSVKQATVELKAMAPAASAAERAAQRWGMTTKEAARSSEDFSKRVQRTIRDLEFERQQLTRNAAEQQKYAALRRAGVSAASAEGQAILASVSALQAQRAAVQKNTEAKKRAADVTQIFAIQFRNLLAIGAGQLGASAIMRAADSFTALTNAIKVSGAEGASLVFVQDRLFAAANKNGVEIDALGQLYSRAAMAGKELGASQEQLLEFVDGVTAALRVQGGSAESSRGALLQLAQALGSGTVRAEEFNSILEGALPIAQAAARGMDGMGGSVAKLRTAIIEGSVTSKMFFDATMKGFGDTRRQAEGSTLTIGQSLTSLSNRFVSYVGNVDKASGASAAFATAIDRVGQTLESANRNVQSGEGGLFEISKVFASTVKEAEGIVKALDRVDAWLRKSAGNFRQWYEEAVGGFVDSFEVAGARAVGGFLGAFTGLPDKLRGVFRESMNAVIETVEAGINSVNRNASSWFSSKDRAPVTIPRIQGNEQFGPFMPPGEAAAQRVLESQRIAREARDQQRLIDRQAGFERDEGRARLGGMPVSGPLGLGGGNAATAGKKGSGSDPYTKAIESAKEYVLTKQAEIKAIGQTVLEAARLKHEQELLNKVQSEGKAVTDAQKAALQGLAGQMAEADAALATAKFMDDAITKGQQFIEQQQIERDTLYMTTEAAMAYRLEKELLNQATAAGITLTTEQIAKIQELASAQAAASESTRRAKEWADFERETFKGLFADINQGLRQGQSIWDAFGNAAMNALNKISDKLMSMAADQLFEAAFPGGGSLGGSLGGLFGGIFGGGGGISAVGGGFDAGAAAGLAGGFMPGFANGAAFRAGNVIPFASGGVVGSPTMFPMSRGRTGLMGEAGPEAIMPLRRGPGGRLGVDAANTNRQQPVIVTVTGDTDLVRVTAEGAAVRVVNQAAPSIEARAVKKAGEQAPAVMARHERQRGGEWRNG